MYLFDEYLLVFWTFCELYWRIRFKNRQILDVFWTLFVNLICELYWRIRFTNKVKKTGRFLTLFVNCIYSINICRFFYLICELYWRIKFPNKVQKNGRFLTFFEPYLWTVFIRLISLFWQSLKFCHALKTK